MRYSGIFMLLVMFGCVVHEDPAQTPNLAVRYFESGQKKFDEHDWVAAADSFTKAIQTNALSKGVKSAKKAFDRSQAETSEISVSDPFTARAYVNRGAARFYSGAFDQSIADYERALRIDPRMGGSIPRSWSCTEWQRGSCGSDALLQSRIVVGCSSL